MFEIVQLSIVYQGGPYIADFSENKSEHPGERPMMCTRGVPTFIKCIDTEYKTPEALATPA